MKLLLEKFTLGPLDNNTYLFIDKKTCLSMVIDPAVPSNELLNEIRENKGVLRYILLTHAHFDHIGGIKWLTNQFDYSISISLHKKDISLWKQGGGATEFGLEYDPKIEPNLIISEDIPLFLGETRIQIIHTPGHTPGHVTYYLPGEKIAFCGDLIFFRSIGRTDLTNSNHSDLIDSIKQKVFTLPPDTILLPGHGPETSVKQEISGNPYL